MSKNENLGVSHCADPFSDVGASDLQNVEGGFGPLGILLLAAICFTAGYCAGEQDASTAAK